MAREVRRQTSLAISRAQLADKLVGNHMATAIRFIDDNHHAKCTRKRHDDIEEEWAADARDHNGVGNVAFIDYAPGQEFRQTGPGMDVLQRGDTVLFHEMVHALHRTNGTLARGRANPVHSLDAKIDADEYQATGLGDYDPRLHTPDDDSTPLTENLYRSERILMHDDDITLRDRCSPDGRQAM